MMTFQGMTFSAIRAQGLLKKSQDALDKKCVSLMENYTPISRKFGFTKASPHKMVYFKNRGKMSKSHKQEKPGVIINTEPKARREYYINKGGSGGLRGKYWFERMKSDHMQELLKAAQEEIT